jgi:hypothetical protein
MRHFVVKSQDGRYYQWKMAEGGDWRGQWVSKAKATWYPVKSKKQLAAIAQMFPELTLTWEAL